MTKRKADSSGGYDTARVVPLGVPPRRDAARGTRPPGRTLGIVGGLVVAAMFYLATATPQPQIDWSPGTLPPGGLNVESLISTPTGFAILAGPQSSGGAIWSTSDGEIWSARSLPRVSTRVVADGEDLLILDARSLVRLNEAPDSALEELPVPEVVRIGYGSGRPGIVAADASLIAQTVTGDVFWSQDGSAFELAVPAQDWRTGTDLSPRSACTPKERQGLDVPPLIRTADRFAAFIAQDDPSGVWPVCEPIVWTSPEGRAWEPMSKVSPFPAGAYVYAVAWRAARYVAVGGIGFDTPMAWTSIDGLEWNELELPVPTRPVDLVDVQAGGLGWVVIGETRDRTGHAGWFSRDARCWELLPDEVIGRAVAVGNDHILVTDRTMQPELWIGTPDRSFSLARQCG